ncbi:MAG TPA: cytochrome c biogenesis protein CcsA [Thermoanaerobaculia bacterium]|nr:cytochrome c biogenesis protein CcsA [Thermoanaerobaculia bacterium]
MTFAPTVTLYVALACYTLGTLAALASLFSRDKRLQYLGLVAMIGGFVAHTVWIGTICVNTGHPPITNLPEAVSFVAWLVFAFELALWIRYRVYAAVFFVYPLVLLMLTISAVVGENFQVLDPNLRSNVFTAHLLLSTVGVASLLIGLAFSLLALMQDRALKNKTRGRLWEWIPSLDICKKVSYRALAIGFSIYTLGLLAGVLWSYRTDAGFMDLRVKQIGAVTAWILFGVLLQSFITNTYRRKRTLFISAGAFVAIVVAMLGIRG